jgi:hypothetical protein
MDDDHDWEWQFVERDDQTQDYYHPVVDDE